MSFKGLLTNLASSVKLEDITELARKEGKSETQVHIFCPFLFSISLKH